MMGAAGGVAQRFDDLSEDTDAVDEAFNDLEDAEFFEEKR